MNKDEMYKMWEAALPLQGTKPNSPNSPKTENSLSASLRPKIEKLRARDARREARHEERIKNYGR